MSDIVEFLRARLDEDEQLAYAATNHGPWTVSYRKCTVLSGRHPVADYLDMKTGDAEHIAHHDPARVLREVAAKREIITNCAGTIGGNVNPGAIGDAEDVVRLLALPYVDHPDYRQEWKL